MSLFAEISDSMAKEEAAHDASERDNAVLSLDEAKGAYLRALRNRALELQNDGNFDLNEADVRFSTALNLSRVRNSLVAIIGAGGLGNWQWRVLASMGFKRIAIYDDDKVGIENVGPQAHSVFDIDIPKVEAVENAALMYRGIKILGRNRRVMSYPEICDDLGENPDIVIGCTDSEDFRNNFITNLTFTIASYGADNQLPDLFIDYRMSLGDWVAYIVPAKAMKLCNSKQRFCEWYRSAAMFSESEAVHEPCTERAIAYTGANVASFTGALMNWFYSGGRRKFHDPEYMRAFIYGETVMPGRKVSFSSRDFEFITDTAKEKKLKKKFFKMREEAGAAWDLLRKGYSIPADFVYHDSGDAIPEDYLERYRGKLLVALKDRKVFLCGFDALFLTSLDAGAPDYNFTIARANSVSLLQPYAVYECGNSGLQEYGLVRMLTEDPGAVFQFGSNRLFVRAQKRYVEKILGYPGESVEYKRVDWEDLSALLYLHQVPSDALGEIVEVFDKFAKEYDDAKVDGGGDEDSDDNVVDLRWKIGRDALEIGMVVTIGEDDEVLTISDITGTHFIARSFNGDETHYSLRRFPDMYLVSDD